MVTLKKGTPQAQQRGKLPQQWQSVISNTLGALEEFKFCRNNECMYNCVITKTIWALHASLRVFSSKNKTKTHETNVAQICILR